MKIKVLQSFSIKGIHQAVGSIIDVSEAEAKTIINMNFAEAYTEPSIPEPKKEQ
jgi:hypothetical protein